MDSKSLDYQRRCAVSKAWSNERKQVLQSRGSRNWSQKEQREILVTGRCHGYEGQHMLSVKAHPEHAGNEKNIQFLTHEEHFQAHDRNWKNDPNGRYNLRTKKVNSYDDGIPKTSYRKLSDPLSDRAKKIANTKYERNNKFSKQQKKEYLPVHKTDIPNCIDRKPNSRSIFNNKTNNNMKSPERSHTNHSGQTSSTGRNHGI